MNKSFLVHFQAGSLSTSIYAEFSLRDTIMISQIKPFARNPPQTTIIKACRRCESRNETNSTALCPYLSSIVLSSKSQQGKLCSNPDGRRCLGGTNNIPWDSWGIMALFLGWSCFSFVELSALWYGEPFWVLVTKNRKAKLWSPSSGVGSGKRGTLWEVSLRPSLRPREIYRLDSALP